jgi:hypothetical protein
MFRPVQPQGIPVIASAVPQRFPLEEIAFVRLIGIVNPIVHPEVASLNIAAGKAQRIGHPKSNLRSPKRRLLVLRGLMIDLPVIDEKLPIKLSLGTDKPSSIELKERIARAAVVELDRVIEEQGVEIMQFELTVRAPIDKSLRSPELDPATPFQVHPMPNQKAIGPILYQSSIRPKIVSKGIQLRGKPRKGPWAHMKVYCDLIQRKDVA